MKKLYLLLFTIFIPFVLSAQVSGVVVDVNDVPLMGVVIQTAEGAISTTSDFDGYFELNVAENTPLEVAFLGYKKLSVKATKDMRIVMMNKGANPKKSNEVQQDLPWSMFIQANAMMAFPFSPAVGLTIGMVRKGGWYLNFMTGFGFHMEDGVTQNGLINKDSYRTLPFYTGASSKQTLSLTAGGVVRLGKVPVYAYMGAGWAYKSVTLETNNGKWLAYITDPASNMSPLHSLALETGILANIKGFALSIGYEPLIGFGGQYSSASAAHEIKIGLGGMFNIKRRTGK